LAQLVIDNQQLDRLQTDKKWSNTELAAAIGVSVTEVYRVRQGRRPGNKFLAGLARASGLTIPYCDLVV
jgi:transcriptional regulator with XRE-family HTH domain